MFFKFGFVVDIHAIVILERLNYFTFAGHDF